MPRPAPCRCSRCYTTASPEWTVSTWSRRCWSRRAAGSSTRAGLADDAIAIFERDTETGELSFVGQAKNGEAGITGLDGVRGLAMTPDGLFLFATSYNDDAVAIFRRDGLSGRS